MKFPEIVAALGADGVEWYSANLLFGATTHYGMDGSHHQTKWAAWTTPAIADSFDAGKVLSAIRSSQKGGIDYPTFLALIAAAGTVYYTVHLKGRKALYFGRHGDFHVEHFPVART